MTGWIKLYRKFLEWEWYTDANVKALFIHCLLKANHEDKAWRGRIIERGSFITSIATLCAETGLTVQEVRTALKKLQKTKEINKQTTNLNTCVTVINYDDYQDINTPINTPPNKRITTTKEGKKIRREEVIELDEDSPTFPKACKYLNEGRRLADLLLDSIIRWDGSHRYARRKPNLDRWVLDFEKAIRLDGRTAEQIEYLIRFVFSGKSPVAKFWAPNINSAGAMVKKFDTIKNQILKERKDGRSFSGYEHRKKQTDGFLDEFYKQSE